MAERREAVLECIEDLRQVFSDNGYVLPDSDELCVLLLLWEVGSATVEDVYEFAATKLINLATGGVMQTVAKEPSTNGRAANKSPSDRLAEIQARKRKYEVDRAGIDAALAAAFAAGEDALIEKLRSQRAKIVNDLEILSIDESFARDALTRQREAEIRQEHAELEAEVNALRERTKREGGELERAARALASAHASFTLVAREHAALSRRVAAATARAQREGLAAPQMFNILSTLNLVRRAGNFVSGTYDLPDAAAEIAKLLTHIDAMRSEPPRRTPPPLDLPLNTPNKRRRAGLSPGGSGSGYEPARDPAEN